MGKIDPDFARKVSTRLRARLPGLAHAQDEILRRILFRRLLRRFRERPEAALDRPGLLRLLTFAWGNAAWSADPTLLRAILGDALQARGPILECGSGLSTLLLGVIAQATGQPLVTLEHDRSWAERVRRELRLHAIQGVELHQGPLRSHGAFDWYDPPSSLPPQFALVVCDGPPGNTRGGRSGLVPVMKDRLVPSTILYLDDIDRQAEQDIGKRWARELPAALTLEGRDRPFGRLIVR